VTLDISIYGIIDPQIARGRSLADLAGRAARSGATLIQYRAKDTATRTMIDEARALVAALAGTRVPLLINDRIDVALAAGAQGVHVGREDMSPSDARRLLGHNAIVGVTIKNEADIRALDPAVASYGCIGGVYQTTHKNNPDKPVGIEGYRSLRTLARSLVPQMPIGAIAGITIENLGPLADAGCDGVAVIGAMFGGDDVEGATRALQSAWQNAKRGR
jgi:thiamine-phosphate pyrophosphorylase